MSFSSDVKKEICSVEQFDREALKAELYGMLLFSRNFSPNKITFTTESNYAGNRLIFLLQNLYMPIIEKQPALRTKSSDSHLYKIIVVDGNDCKRIFEDSVIRTVRLLCVSTGQIFQAKNFRKRFCVAFFLAAVRYPIPMKSYHLEFCVPHKNLSQDLCKILSEITECTLIPKTVVRSGSYIVYFKESEQICDLLTYIGSPIRSMEIMVQRQ